MDNREVTEFDLRAEEFKHPSIKPEEFEFRADGKIVRKDRYERGFRSLVESAGFSLRGFEIDDVVNKITSVLDVINSDEFDHEKMMEMIDQIDTYGKFDVKDIQTFLHQLFALRNEG